MPLGWLILQAPEAKLVAQYSHRKSPCGVHGNEGSVFPGKQQRVTRCSIKILVWGGQAHGEGLLVCLSAHFTFHLEGKLLFPLFIDLSHVKRMPSTL